MDTPSPLKTLEISHIWSVALSGEHKYLLIGDSDHRDHSFLKVVTAAYPLFARRGISGLANEHPFNDLDSVASAFNQASWWDKLSGADIRQVHNGLRYYSLGWDKSEADKEARRQLIAAQIIQGRRYGVPFHPISLLPDNPFEAFDNLSFATRQRLQTTYRYLQRFGQRPQFYDNCDSLWWLDHAYIRQVEQRRDRENFALDRDHARVIEALAGQGDRLAIKYGAGHFRGAQSDGIDAFLPQDQQVYVLLANQSTQFAIHPSAGKRNPDFIVRTDLNEGWVMPSAIDRGLWPQPAP